MEARVTKVVVRASARFSKSLASRRLHPNQEKVVDHPAAGQHGEAICAVVPDETLGLIPKADQTGNRTARSLSLAGLAATFPRPF